MKEIDEGKKIRLRIKVQVIIKSKRCKKSGIIIMWCDSPLRSDCRIPIHVLKQEISPTLESVFSSLTRRSTAIGGLLDPNYRYKSSMLGGHRKYLPLMLCHFSLSSKRLALYCGMWWGTNELRRWKEEEVVIILREA